MTDEPAPPAEAAEEEGVDYERLMRVFRRKNPDGSFYYTDEEVRHWLPLAFLASNIPMEEWTPAMLNIFTEGMKAAGIDPNTKKPCQKLAAYYRRHPVNAEMEQELREIVNMGSLEASEAVAARFRRLQSKAKGSSLQDGLAPGGGGAGLRPNRGKKRPF